jgi:hypothetical protein
VSSGVRGNLVTGTTLSGPSYAGQSMREIENVVIIGNVEADDEALFWLLDGQLVAVYHALDTGTCDVSLYRVRGGTQTWIDDYAVIAGSSGRIALDPAIDLVAGDRIFLWVTDASTSPQATILHFGCELTH